MIKIILLFSLFTFILLFGCSQPLYEKTSTVNNTSLNLESQKVAQNQYNNKIKQSDNLTIEDKNLIKKTIYNYSNYKFIYTYGIDKERIITIVSTINPVYFEGVSMIEFVKTNKFWSNSKDGWYYPDSKSIRIFVDYEGDEFIERIILHELSHAHCFTKERESFDKCLKENSKMTDGFDNAKLWDYCYHDEGCFLNTPIDKEYGFIK